MRYRDFSKSLLLHKGIVRIELLSEDIANKLIELDFAPNKDAFMPQDPVGLNEVLSKDLKLILLCSNEFEMFTEPFMDLVDCRGNIVGHDIVGDDKTGLEDMIWICSNIYLDPNLLTEHRIRNVIHSVPLHLEGIPEEIRPRVFYPSLDSYRYLKEKFGAKGNIASIAVLGVNGVEFNR